MHIPKTIHYEYSFSHNCSEQAELISEYFSLEVLTPYVLPSIYSQNSNSLKGLYSEKFHVSDF